jgi:hypothetical protein
MNLNSIFVVLTHVIDALLIVVGFVIMCYGVYVAPGVSDNGQLNTTYFNYMFIGCVFATVHIILSAVMSCQGTKWQKLNPSPDDVYPWLTGRRMLIARNVFALALVMVSAWTLVGFYSLDMSFNNTRDDLEAGMNPVYDAFELDFSHDFNERYFSAVDTCGGSDWLWDIIKERCAYTDTDDSSGSLTMQEKQCDADCGNTEGTCSITEADCDAAVSDCPYDECRLGLLNFMLDWMEYAYYISAITFALALVQFISTAFLMCYHHKASFIEVLVQTGAVKRTDKDTLHRKAPKKTVQMFWTQESRENIVKRNDRILELEAAKKRQEDADKPKINFHAPKDK